MIDITAFDGNHTPILYDRAGSLCAALVPLTKGRFALISEEDEFAIAGYSWCFKSGYGVRCLPRTKEERGHRGRQKMILMHRVIMRVGPDHEVDHINRLRHDSRRSNMRVATSQQNAMNTAKNATNRSGFKGVHWCKQDKKWKASIRVDGRKKHLGYHRTPEAAAMAYDRAAQTHFGEFAVLNFPQDAANRVASALEDELQ